MTTINPGLRLVRRTATSAQIGVGPGGIVIDGLNEADFAFLAALRGGIPEGAVVERAGRCGVPPERALEICAALSGLLFTDAELRTEGYRAERLLPETTALLALHHAPSRGYMARREHGVVQVLGLGRTGAALAQVLVGAGVGTVLLEDDRAVTAVDVGPGAFRLSDIGLLRSVAVRRHLLAVDPSCHAHVVHAGGAGGPDPRCLDLAIAVGHDAVGAALSSRLMGSDRAHMFVLVREQDGTVGPLVVPGSTACGECVERHRGSGDAQWLQVCGQLAAAALVFLDGVNRPSAWSSVLTFHPDDGRWSRREFAPHPACGCQLQRQALETISSTASP